MLTQQQYFTAGVAQLVRDVFDKHGKMDEKWYLNVALSDRHLTDRIRDSIETDPRLERIAEGLVDAMIEDEGCNLTVGEIVTILSYALAIKLPMELGASKETADLLVGSAVFLIQTADTVLNLIGVDSNEQQR